MTEALGEYRIGNTLNGMKSIFRLASIMVVSIAMCSCRGNSVAEDSPEFVKELVERISKEDVRNPPAKIFRYNFKEATVYYLTAYCCDIPSQLFHEDSSIICSPDGGISGVGDGKCPDFYETRRDEELVWADRR